MKYAVPAIFSCVILLLAAFFFVSAVNSAGQLNWYTDYKAATDFAKKSNKPIALFFTGSDWCSYCHKMEDEVLSTPEFKNALGDQFVFLKLDFPKKQDQDPNIKAQNNALLEKYNIEGFPTLVILDSNTQIIGTIGYRPGGAKYYINYLKRMVQEHTSEKVETPQHPSEVMR